ncbi:MAG: N-6 DNA methylase, partial [Candidatus Bathyarchaeota archaeon]|nr:N-6 DNA methylase [Candidatus Bathyarchaeota archaeon]
MDNSKIELLLHRIRLSRAREGDPKETLYALLEEIEHSTGYSGRDSWNIMVELIADYLGIIKDPWRYSLPGFQNEPLFKGREAFSKQSFRISERALKVKEHCAELVEMYVACARANPWDHLGEIFMEQRLQGRNLGQMLTPRSVVELMVQMVMPEYTKSQDQVWTDSETILWANEYTERYGYFPFWAGNAVEEAFKTLEAYVKPKTVLDPAVGTGRFLIGASLMFPGAPLVLFGIEIDLSLYRACLVNMALFSKHPYTIICADTLRIDEKYAHTTSPIWDCGNLWEPPDFSPFYWKESPITAEK